MPNTVAACNLSPLPRRALSVLLQGAWVGVLGDSVARLFYAALLRSAGLSPEQRVVVGHRSFEHPLAAGSRGSFVWAPYAENITESLRTWHASGAAPGVVVMGASLWHMLHVGNAAEYGSALSRMREAAAVLRSSHEGDLESARVRRKPLCFWMTTTALVTQKLLTEEKRAQLTPERIRAYDEAARTAQLLGPDGLCLPLDVYSITRGAPCHMWVSTHAADAHAPDCGASCTEDGMHFSNTTYDALVQQWANAMRLERRSRACELATRLASKHRPRLCVLPGC